MNEFLCKRLLMGEGVKFALYQSRGKAYSLAKLLETAAIHCTGVRQLHTLAEQSFVEGKDSWFVEVEAGVDEVVGGG